MSSPCLTCGRRAVYRPAICCVYSCYHIEGQEELVKQGELISGTVLCQNILNEIYKAGLKFNEKEREHDFDEELKQILQEHRQLFTTSTDEKKRRFRKIARDAGWTDSEIEKAMKVLEEKS